MILADGEPPRSLSRGSARGAAGRVGISFMIWRKLSSRNSMCYLFSIEAKADMATLYKIGANWFLARPNLTIKVKRILVDSVNTISDEERVQFFRKLAYTEGRFSGLFSKAGWYDVHSCSKRVNNSYCSADV